MYDPPHNNDNGGPPGAALPLSEAVRRLPAIYWRVFTRPSAATFAEEVGGARWDIVWTQLLGLMIVTLVYTILWQQFYMPHFLAAQALFTPSASNVGAGAVPDPIPPQTIQNITRIATGAFVVLSPAFFFMVQGLYYLLARRMFHGQGTFLVQCHTSLLAQVPINLASIASALLSGLVAFFPATAAFTMPTIWLYSLAVSIYSYVLQIMAIMAAHRLNAMNAAGVVFIPLAILMLLIFILVMILATVLVYTIIMMQMNY